MSRTRAGGAQYATVIPISGEQIASQTPPGHNHHHGGVVVVVLPPLILRKEVSILRTGKSRVRKSSHFNNYRIVLHLLISECAPFLFFPCAHELCLQEWARVEKVPEDGRTYGLDCRMAKRKGIPMKLHISKVFMSFALWIFTRPFSGSQQDENAIDEIQNERTNESHCMKRSTAHSNDVPHPSVFCGASLFALVISFNCSTALSLLLLGWDLSEPPPSPPPFLAVVAEESKKRQAGAFFATSDERTACESLFYYSCGCTYAAQVGRAEQLHMMRMIWTHLDVYVAFVNAK